MLNVAPASTREEILARVRELIADQLALSAFEVKSDDDINTCLGAAGLDVVEIFQAVHREFGTDFSDLGEYLQYFFYPEISPTPTQIWIVGIIAVFLTFGFWVARTYPALIAASLILGVVALLILVWKIVNFYRDREYEPQLLTFTVGDIVDAVVVGKWVPPEDIWDRIDRLGRRRASN